MRALTIWQPWAWMVAEGVKRTENRGKRTRYRGPLAIHAGKAREGIDEFTWGSLPESAYLRFEEQPLGTQQQLWDRLRGDIPFAFGAIVAIGELVDCLPLAQVDRWAYPFAGGPWCWILQDVRRLDVAIPCRGYQGLWTPPVEAVAGLVP